MRKRRKIGRETLALGGFLPTRFGEEPEYIDKLGRALLKIDTHLKYKTGRNLAEIRQWYYQQSQTGQQTFKEKLQALVNASEWFDGAFVPIAVALHLRQTWHSQDGEDSISLEADATPATVLAAIAQWDGADEDEKTWSIG